MPANVADAIPPDTDLVFVWGEGAPLSAIPQSAKVILLNAYEQPGNQRADVLIPISVQTERHGHYTNFAGVITGFEQCFPKRHNVADAETLFEAMFSVSTVHAPRAG
jgi:NADH-quinone oxidoreductase subunit G